MKSFWLHIKLYWRLIKIPSKVLHKIHIDYYLTFMQEFLTPTVYIMVFLPKWRSQRLYR